MPTFINLDLDRKVPRSFLTKHLLFSVFWIIGILIFAFRIDIIFIERHPSSLEWLKMIIPILFIISAIVLFFSLKWYYKLAFLCYPILLAFWFIPKTVLINGKIYLFADYITSVFSKFLHLKRTIAHAFLLLFTLILFTTISLDWIRWGTIFIFSYFYIRYVLMLLRKSFQPSLFEKDLTNKIRDLIQKNNVKESIVINSFINRKDDEQLEFAERREKHIRRSIIANQTICLITDKLKSFRGRKAFIASWLYSTCMFFLYSVIFFWFLNIQLFRINSLNFIYTGTIPAFDFFYYTLKTITFGSTDLIKPISVLARLSEMSSFFIIGIFFLVIFISVLFSLKQDKINENIQLSTDLFESEKTILSKYFKEEFGMELGLAIAQVRNIDESLKTLRDIMNRLF